MAFSLSILAPCLASYGCAVPRVRTSICFVPRDHDGVALRTLQVLQMLAGSGAICGVGLRAVGWLRRTTSTESSQDNEQINQSHTDTTFVRSSVMHVKSFVPLDAITSGRIS